MKYARYTAGSGEIEGLYDTAVHNTIPSRTVEITDEQWSDIVSNPGKYLIDTTTTTLVEKTSHTLAEISAYRISGQERVDHAAEAVRRKFLTLTAGQDTIYMWKYEEALTFKNMGGPEDQLDNFPLVKSDYEAFEEAELNKTPLQVAEGIVDKHNEARAAAVALEKLRRSAKERIAKTNSRAAIDSIVEYTLNEMEKI